MAHSIEMTTIDDQIPLLPQTENDEIEEWRKVDHLIDIKETNGQDTLWSQTKKSVNQIFDEMLENLDNSSIEACTIFKVNVGLRESNPDAYTPKMISIGPYHKKNPQRCSMEKYKLLYLQRFLQRKEGLDVESCINELKELKEEAIKCYEDIDELGNDSRFCQMLLLDGCFVVEFIREYCEMCLQGEEDIINIKDSYIFRDLILLENQLPFFVLNKLHYITKQDDDLPLPILAITSFTFFIDLSKMTPKSFGEIECNAENIKHLLHVVHIFSCYENPMKNSKDSI
ncbi:hypothetical protein H5410_019925 [Solanum commersonii]|uniref:Uncharacterized protein n=1 Tax=Solanum commersonii TaxID=4109 RepID=A0A9J5ZB00_SOLCO|nr:hypothetical protein H5410_019925 [Solanum commersonii]